VVTFGGAASGWYDYSPAVTWTVADPSAGDAAISGVQGFTQTWDTSIPDEFHDNTQGCCSYFWNGPQFPNATSGFLDIPASQGCHTVHVRAWDNRSQTGGEYTKSGMCYDSIKPTISSVKYANLSNTSVKISGVATDTGCGTTGSCVATLFYYYNTATNGSNTGSWVYLGSSAGASGSFTWSTIGIAAGKHLIAVDPEDYAGNVLGCTAAGGNTCPNTYTVDSLTVKNTVKKIKTVPTVLGSVKFTGALTPNPCVLASCLYTSVANGSSAKFTATAKKGHSFSHWVINGKSGSTSKTVGVTFKANTTVSAVFS
jgi:hypothetical protein